MNSIIRHDLTQLRVQAKELLRAIRAGEPAALQRALAYFDSKTEFKLAQAQLIVARENGFPSWSRLKQATEGAPEISPTQRFFALVESGDSAAVAESLARSPELAGAWRKTSYGAWVTALHVAAERGYLPVAKALIDAGAQVYAMQQSDYPPIFSAFDSGNQELIDYLMRVSQETDSGQPPTYGCGIDIVIAARLGLEDRIRMHLDRDPLAVYRRGCIGESVLHWPAHNGFVDIVSLLLDAGAHIEADEIGLYGGKPLHWASEHEPACVAFLLERGANPNARNLMPGDFEGFTPLHMAASQREQCIECAEHLLKAGCDPTLKDAKGLTAYEVAKGGGKDRMAAFLKRVD